METVLAMEESFAQALRMFCPTVLAIETVAMTLAAMTVVLAIEAVVAMKKCTQQSSMKPTN